MSTIPILELSEMTLLSLSFDIFLWGAGIIDLFDPKLRREIAWNREEPSNSTKGTKVFGEVNIEMTINA
jgi:hypothetical protein